MSVSFTNWSVNEWQCDSESLPRTADGIGLHFSDKVNAQTGDAKTTPSDALIKSLLLNCQRNQMKTNDPEYVQRTNVCRHPSQFLQWVRRRRLSSSWVGLQMLPPPAGNCQRRVLDGCPKSRSVWFLTCDDDDDDNDIFGGLQIMYASIACAARWTIRIVMLIGWITDRWSTATVCVSDRRA